MGTHVVPAAGRKNDFTLSQSSPHVRMWLPFKPKPAEVLTFDQLNIFTRTKY